MSCGVGHRRGSDLVLLWLWCRPAVTAPIGPLAWEVSYASGVALKSEKTPQTNKETKKQIGKVDRSPSLFWPSGFRHSRIHWNNLWDHKFQWLDYKNIHNKQSVVKPPPPLFFAESPSCFWESGNPHVAGSPTFPLGGGQNFHGLLLSSDARVFFVPVVICCHLSPQAGGWSPPGGKGCQPNRWPLPVWLQHRHMWAYPPAGWVTAPGWDPGLHLHTPGYARHCLWPGAWGWGPPLVSSSPASELHAGALRHHSVSFLIFTLFIYLVFLSF